MVTKKDLVIAVLITFCLTAMLFSVRFTRSQAPGQYDPWLDINDDGKILIEDVAWVSRAYGTTGDPINKTALLYNVNDTFTSLLAKIDSLNSSLSVLQSEVDGLNVTVLQYQSLIDSLNSTLTSKINSLESELAGLDATIATKLGSPDFDSGYYQINQSQSIIFTHNLGTTDVLVYMVGYYPGSVPYIHQHDYGGEANGLNTYGVYWSELTTTTIKVTRNGNDNNWPYVRVMMWKVYK